MGYGVQYLPNSQRDAEFDNHYNGFKGKLPLGAYYYAYGTSYDTGRKEAENCLSYMGDKQFEMSIYYDMEENRNTKEAGQGFVDRIANAVKKTGDTMTGNLNMQSNSVKFGTTGNVLWKEDGFGDKFRIIPNFSGAGANNRLIIQSTTGEAGTDPQNWKDLVTIHDDSGGVYNGVSGKKLVETSDLLNLIYPVGSIYMSVNSTNPENLFGGTWEQIKDRFLLSAGNSYANGSTGGSATHTIAVGNLPAHTHTYSNATAVQGHTLTVNEMPKHKHNSNVRINWYNGTGYGPVFNQGNSSNVGVDRDTTYTDEIGGGQAHSHGLTKANANTGSTGSGTALNTMPPYLVVYM